jgi:hypothetical protein
MARSTIEAYKWHFFACRAPFFGHVSRKYGIPTLQKAFIGAKNRLVARGQRGGKKEPFFIHTKAF